MAGTLSVPSPAVLRKAAQGEAAALAALLADTGDHRQENLERCGTAGIAPDIPDARLHHTRRWPSGSLGQPTPAEATAHRLRTREGKARYAKRKATVETVFGSQSRRWRSS